MPTVFSPVNPHFNFSRSQRVALNQIDRWGRDAAIRRPGRADIQVRAVFLQYEPNEYPGQRLDVLDRTVLVAPIDQNGNSVAEPDPEQDRLITWQVTMTGQTAQPLTQDESLQITMRSDRLNMDGTLLYWELRVRR